MEQVTRVLRATEPNEHGEYAKLEHNNVKGYCLAELLAGDGSSIMRSRADRPRDAVDSLADRLAAAQHWAQLHDAALGEKADRHMRLAWALQGMVGEVLQPKDQTPSASETMWAITGVQANGGRWDNDRLFTWEQANEEAEEMFGDKPAVVTVELDEYRRATVDDIPDFFEGVVDRVSEWVHECEALQWDDGGPEVEATLKGPEADALRAALKAYLAAHTDMSGAAWQQTGVTKTVARAAAEVQP